MSESGSSFHIPNTFSLFFKGPQRKVTFKKRLCEVEQMVCSALTNRISFLRFCSSLP